MNLEHLIDFLVAKERELLEESRDTPLHDDRHDEINAQLNLLEEIFEWLS